MAININQASVKDMTTLPVIGTKFAQIIVCINQELGSVVTIDAFHDNLALQTKLNELAERADNNRIHWNTPN